MKTELIYTVSCLAVATIVYHGYNDLKVFSPEHHPFPRGVEMDIQRVLEGQDVILINRAMDIVPPFPRDAVMDIRYVLVDRDVM
jgi:hypothetical protein